MLKLSNLLNLKSIMIIVIITYIILLIPLVMISVYDHPSNDDYVYSIETVHTWRETGSVAEVLKTAAEKTKTVYNEWQGTFTAIPLFSVQPAMWDPSLYKITPIFMLAMLTFSTIFIFRTVLKKYFGAGTCVYVISALFVAAISIQLMPSPVEGLYWWNGAVYYTFFYSLSLFMFSFILLALKTGNKTAMILYTSAGIVLAFLIGGANYITVFMTIIVLLLFAAWQIYLKNKRVFIILLALAAVGVSFFISAQSPGNAVRAENYSLRQTFIPGLLAYCFYLAFHYVSEWTSMLMTGAAVLLGLLLYPVAARQKFNFKYPLLVTAASFCLLAAQFAAPVYGMGSEGSGRIINIVFFFYLLLLTANVFYWCGWLKCFKEKVCGNYKIVNKKRVYAGAMLFFTFGIIMKAAWINHPETARKWSSVFTSASAGYSLISGEAKTYSGECISRRETLEDPSKDNIVFKPFSVNPYLLYYSDLTGDPSYEWSNRPIGDYYDKKSVIVDWSDYTSPDEN